MTGKPMKKSNVHARKLGSEWLLYEAETEKLHVLNPTAEFVWRLCDGSRDIEDIKNEMRNKFKITDEQKLEDDLNAVLNEFVQIGVIQGL